MGALISRLLIRKSLMLTAYLAGTIFCSCLQSFCYRILQIQNLLLNVNKINKWEATLCLGGFVFLWTSSASFMYQCFTLVCMWNSLQFFNQSFFIACIYCNLIKLTPSIELSFPCLLSPSFWVVLMGFIMPFSYIDLMYFYIISPSIIFFPSFPPLLPPKMLK
jgi:hypothetical protein